MQLVGHRTGAGAAELQDANEPGEIFRCVFVRVCEGFPVGVPSQK